MSIAVNELNLLHTRYVAESITRIHISTIRK
jgi:hypothetical protein